MKQNNEINRNRGFKTSFRAGMIMLLIFSLLGFWAFSRVFRIMERNFETNPGKNELSGQIKTRDTVFADRIREKIIIIRDTIYPKQTPQRTKSEISGSIEKDTSIDLKSQIPKI